MAAEGIFVHEMIVPTVLIPLTAISVVLSSVAVFIAGLFGLQLKAEGPKKLLEVLLKPRVLLTSAVISFAIWSGVHLFFYVVRASSFDFVVQWRQNLIKESSARHYADVLQAFTGSVLRGTKSLREFEVQTVWKTSLKKGAFAPVAVSGESIFIGSDDHYIYELDAKSGVILRQFFVGTEVTPTPVVFNGALYAGEGNHDTHHARVSKYDLASGAYVGSVRTIGHIEGQLNVDSRGAPLLYASGGKGGLYAIDLATMKLKWNSRAGHSDSGARYDGNLVFYGSGREKYVVDQYRSWAVAVDRDTGREVWRREMPASSWMQPVVLRDRVCFVFGEIYFKSEVGGLGCFRKTTGEAVGFYYHTAPIVADPLVMGDSIYLVDIHGRACRVEQNSMLLKWCQSEKLVDKTYAGLRYDAPTDTLIQVTRKNGIRFLDPDRGTVVAKWPLNLTNAREFFASPTPLGGDWLMIDADGDLTRLRLGRIGRLQAQWTGPELVK